MKSLTTNIQKGGALLSDSRLVVEEWDCAADASSNLARIAQGNLLGKTSHARSDDVLRRIIGPRLVAPGTQVMAALKELLPHPRAFTEACYFEATRDEELLAHFAEGPVFAWYESGRLAVNVGMTMEWLVALAAEGRIPLWTEVIRTRVSRGLLAALRDFGILRGATRKEIDRPHLSLTGFAYVAYRLHQEGASSHALLSTRVWRRWLLDQARVDELFSAADRRGIMRFSSVGSAVRVDWLADSLSEVARAAA